MKIDRLLTILWIVLMAILIILSLSRESQRQNFLQQLQTVNTKLSAQEDALEKIASARPVPGPKGTPGKNCTAVPAAIGSYIVCADGSSTLIRNGAEGKPGAIIEVPAKGPQGSAGKPGGTPPSNYDLWLQAGNKGTMTDYLNSLVGPAGSDGRTVQFRCNPIKLQVEYRYTGDTVVHPLNQVLACAPGSTTFQ